MKKPITEKKYTFRHLREVRFLPNTITENDAKKKLIEAELARGYIPINVKFTEIKYNDPTSIKTIHYHQAYCYSAYAGKKMARIIYEKLGKEIKEGNAGDIIKIPNRW